jgi:benzoyl-CoA reductase/2-hydroxyglutaryl-CoA dehydratase subunit BcrC/BadD/HgdB
MAHSLENSSLSRQQRFGLIAGRRLMQSRAPWRLAKAMVPRWFTTKAHDRVAYAFFLGLGEWLYADHTKPILWCNIALPSELVWGLGMVPFSPETAAGLSVGLGLSTLGLDTSEAIGYPVDLCSFNRCAAGLNAADLCPGSDTYVACSNVCDVSGQLLAEFAQDRGRPYHLLDVPQSQDEAALAYLTAQLTDLVERVTSEVGISYDPDRMRQAVRLSNQARVLALEVAELRESDPAPIRGSSMLGQLGMLTTMFGHPGALAYYTALRDYVLERQRGTPEQPNQRLRLYWMHLRPYYSSDLLAHLEDDLGGVIAFEETSTLWWPALDEEQPLRALAGKILAQYMNGPLERRADLALSHIERYQCIGAIHFSHWGCRQSNGALHVLRTRLRRAGIPLLAIDGDCVDPANLQEGPLRTRIDAFVEMLS